MIQFELIASCDGDFCGTYTTFQSSISLGKNSSCDLIVRDPKLKAKHLVFDLQEQGLLVRSFASKNSFLVNGKKVSGTTIIKKSDIITIEDTQLKLLDFKFSPDKVQSSETLRKSLIDIKENHPLTADLLIELKRELTNLQIKDNKN